MNQKPYWSGKKRSRITKERIRTSCKKVRVVHHLNGNHNDNRPSNLVMLTPRQHAKIHCFQRKDVKPYGGGRTKLRRNK